MATETEIIMLPIIVVDTQDNIVIPQIPLCLHTYGDMERPATTCTLVEHDASLLLVTKGLTL